MTRLAHAWRALEREQRLAAMTALGLFVSMFLPWYSKADTFVEHGSARATQTSLSAFQAFSFVEAAVLLVSAGVLFLLFARAEERDFQLPGGDGLIVMVAGAWVALLIFYRLLDKPGLQASQRITATVGVEWGIFIALLLALGLLYAGRLMRAEERPEPPLVRRRPSHPSGSPDPQRPRSRSAASRSDVRRSAAPTSETSSEAPLSEAPTSEAPRSVRPIPARAPLSSKPAAPERDRKPEPEREGTPPMPDTEPKLRTFDDETEALPRGGPHRSSTGRPRYPPGPSEQQMSFEEPPASTEGER